MLSSGLYKNDRLLLDTFVGWAKVSIVLISYILNLKINENKYIGSLTNIIIRVVILEREDILMHTMAMSYK